MLQAVKKKQQPPSPTTGSSSQSATSPGRSSPASITNVASSTSPSSSSAAVSSMIQTSSSSPQIASSAIPVPSLDNKDVSWTSSKSFRVKFLHLIFCYFRLEQPLPPYQLLRAVAVWAVQSPKETVMLLKPWIRMERRRRTAVRPVVRRSAWQVNRIT